MIEPAMYGAIGFLVALLLGLMFLPLVHNRAVRLTRRRLEAATPLSLAEIQADKDQMRAEFAMAARRLELTVEQLRNRAAVQAADLGKKTDAFNRMRLELDEKNVALETRGPDVSHVADDMRAMEAALARRQTEAGAAEALGDAAAESRRAELTAAHARAEALTRRVGELKEDLAAKLALIGDRDATIDTLRQSIEDAQRRFDAVVEENTAKTKRSAMGKLKAEKAAVDGRLREANDAQARALRELSDLRQETETAREAERAEAALLRERIHDIAAEVAKLALSMEGPDGAIGAILATDRIDGNGSGTPADDDAQQSLAGRIRALQARTTHAAATV